MSHRTLESSIVYEQDSPRVLPLLGDLFLQATIERDLADVEALRGARIEVKVLHGVVHLIGEVVNHRQITTATRVVFRIPAVKSLACRLAVRSAERARAARI